MWRHCKYVIQESVRVNRVYESLHVWFTCAFRMLMCLCGFMLILETKNESHFLCVYVCAKNPCLNRCVWMMEKHLAFFTQWSLSAAHFSRWRCGCGYKMPAVALQDWCFWNPPSLCIPFQHKKTCPPAKVLLHCFHHHYFKRKQNCELRSPRY